MRNNTLELPKNILSDTPVVSTSMKNAVISHTNKIIKSGVIRKVRADLEIESQCSHNVRLITSRIINNCVFITIYNNPLSQ